MDNTKVMILVVILLLFPSFSVSQDIYPKYDDIQYNEAAAYFDDALNRLYIVGLQYLNDGVLNQAEISFRSILAFPYRNQDWRVTRYYKGKAHYYLGDIYFIQKKYLKSSSHYQNIVQNYGEIEEYRSALFKLGRAFILSQQEKKGIEVLQDYYSHYAEKDCLAESSLYWIAQGYIRLENYNVALKLLQQILRDYPNSSIAYNTRILIADLETNFIENSYTNHQKNELPIVDSSENKLDKIIKEKELVNRIQKLLSLKEHMLQIKERKLKLLESIGKIRMKVLQNKREFAQQDSMRFME